jgi:hypothetical protein
LDDFRFWPAYRFGLARSQNDQGNVLRGSGQPREAEKAYRQAVALLGKPANVLASGPRRRLCWGGASDRCR